MFKMWRQNEENKCRNKCYNIDFGTIKETEKCYPREVTHLASEKAVILGFVVISSCQYLTVFTIPGKTKTVNHKVQPLDIKNISGKCAWET